MSARRFAACGWAALLVAAQSVGVAAEVSLADVAESESFLKLRALVEQKADVNATQADGMTALHWAAHHDDFESAKLLITAGAHAKRLAATA